MKTIFYFEGRGCEFMYHFVAYMLSNLYYIENNIYNKRGPPNSSVLYRFQYCIKTVTKYIISYSCIYDKCFTFS